MASVNRRWLSPAIIAIAGVASLVAYGRLPAMVNPRLEGLLPFTPINTSGAVPRWLTLTAMPVLALALWIAFRLAPIPPGRRLGRRMFRHAPTEVTSSAQFERFGTTYDTIVLGVVMLIIGLHAAMLAAGAAGSGDSGADRARRAWRDSCSDGERHASVATQSGGRLRTKRLLADPHLWRGAHRVFGRASFAASGLVTMAAAVVAARFGLIDGIASLAVALAIGAVASTRPNGTAPSVALIGVATLCATTPGLFAQMPRSAATPIELNAPARRSGIRAALVRDGVLVPWRVVARDGAELPRTRQTT